MPGFKYPLHNYILRYLPPHDQPAAGNLPRHTAQRVLMCARSVLLEFIITGKPVCKSEDPEMLQQDLNPKQDEDESSCKFCF